ncbi:MAG: zinc ribbon domain-containing protein [Eubacterium sp.]|nr:zinc ribbon domain-containing protein [Eubacterium sp.]MDD7208866.1 hypothetical protein [Lachnospiraceae bacterium]MDY5498126.1 hypothetical protein [Anaerobutyricum sp.]
MFYRCKSCGGNVVYDPEKKKMICESCRNEGEHQLVKQEKVHVCNNCGAKIDAGADALALKCPYCGTYVIFEDRMEREYEPKLILPFSLNKEKAVETLRDNFKGKLFLPKDFCSVSSVEAMEGIYVPFFMYDMHSHVHFEGEGDKIRVWKEGDYEVTETRVYHITRDFEVDYDKIPVDASSAMPDNLMDIMEPYRYEDLGDFTPEYLSGFVANRYDEDRDSLLPRARHKTEKFDEAYLSETNQLYHAVRKINKTVDCREKESFYAFLPVWKYVYRYREKEYEFYVNGQTGKAVGTPPVSWSRAALLTFSTGISVFFCLAMLLYFLEVL